MKLSYFFSILLLCAFVSSASSQATREIQKTIPLKSDGLLIIDTYKGSITITTHDKPQMEVYVKIESDDSDSEDPARDVEDTEIQINGSENEISLRTNYRKVERHHRNDFWDWIANPFESSNSLPLVHYTIKMPRTAELRITDYKSKTRIEDLNSELRFNTYKGEAEIENLFGGIDLETYKGTVHVSFSKMKNDSRFETYKGTITVAMPKENGFNLQTDFEKRVDFSADFDVQSVERGKKHHHYYDYRGSINGGGPVLELKSDKGDIRLRVK
jgi:hypothetical protein